MIGRERCSGRTREEQRKVKRIGEKEIDTQRGIERDDR